MMLIEDSAVSDSALPVAAFRAHLRMGTGFDEDSLQDAVLQGFLRAAIAAIEARTGKALILWAFTLVLDEWRNAMSQTLPVAPVKEITAVTMLTPLGEDITVPAETYWLEQDMNRPHLRPRGMLLPHVPSEGSVRIAFVAGYAVEFGDVPADLAQAVLMLAAHYYEFRHETALPARCMPFGVSSLIERYKALSIGAGTR